VPLLALVALAPSASARPVAHTAAHSLTGGVRHERTFQLPRRATHVAVYWRGNRDARVLAALSRDGRRFGRLHRMQLDETGSPRHKGETYGVLMLAHGARAVRVVTDRPLSRVSILALTDRGGPAPKLLRLRSATATAQPSVISRAGWGADESLRFDSTGKEIWPPAFYPVQKLIVHHTATQNNDPNPPATIRSIYYYHAVTQGWGDIGYNFLIDESGHIYEGRHSQNSWDPALYPSGPTGADPSGNGVTGAHAQGYNSGTVGIALLGTLTSQDATPAARDALERLLAWEASTHGLDPQGSSLYTNPVSGLQATFPNIAGHRDVNATECPGGTFYATLPAIRADVAALISGSPPPPPPPDFQLSASPSNAMVVRGGSVSYTVSAAPVNSFSGTLSFAASGLPSYSTASFSPPTLALPPSGSTTLTVATSKSTQNGSRTITVTGSGGGVSHTTSVTLNVKRK
jgi:hypothetical protein